MNSDWEVISDDQCNDESYKSNIFTKLKISNMIFNNVYPNLEEYVKHLETELNNEKEKNKNILTEYEKLESLNLNLFLEKKYIEEDNLENIKNLDLKYKNNNQVLESRIMEILKEFQNNLNNLGKKYYDDFYKSREQNGDLILEREDLIIKLNQADKEKEEIYKQFRELEIDLEKEKL